MILRSRVPPEDSGMKFFLIYSQRANRPYVSTYDLPTLCSSNTFNINPTIKILHR